MRSDKTPTRRTVAGAGKDFFEGNRTNKQKQLRRICGTTKINAQKRLHQQLQGKAKLPTQSDLRTTLEVLESPMLLFKEREEVL